MGKGELKEKLARNIKEILKSSENDSTTWIELDDVEKPICLVLAWENGELKGKLAKNIDDLQYDYEIDWEMPSNDGETINTELTLNNENLVEAVNWWLKELESIYA